MDIEGLIKEAVKRIIDGFNQKIILFGSYAYEGIRLPTAIWIC